ncbi:MAG: hypothetical protein ACOCXM_03205 [Myxococcota bacterium]
MATVARARIAEDLEPRRLRMLFTPTSIRSPREARMRNATTRFRFESPEPPSRDELVERLERDLHRASGLEDGELQALSDFVQSAPHEALLRAWRASSWGGALGPIRREAFEGDPEYRAARWAVLTTIERRRWVKLRLRTLNSAGVTGVLPEDLGRVARGAPEWTNGPAGVVRRWLAERPTAGLLLVGTRGTGKTCAACLAIAEEWPRTWRGEPYPRFTTAQELAHGPFHPWSRDRAGRRDILEVSMLVLDDLAAEDGNDLAPAMAEILDARAALPTVITTNLGPRSLEERYGPRIADRLRQRFTLASFGGPSLRRSAPGWEAFER